MGAGRGGDIPPKNPGPNPSQDLETTAQLLARVRCGDERARNILAGRYYSVLRRLAHGRLPRSRRPLEDTDDIVQKTITKALDHLNTFEVRGDGAYLAYLRKILFTTIADGFRSANRSPAHVELGEEIANPNLSPLEEAIGKDRLEAYQAALETLRDEQQEAVILRLEMGCTYEEIADAINSKVDCGQPRQTPLTANAARMLVTRALVKVAEAMRVHRDDDREREPS